MMLFAPSLLMANECPPGSQNPNCSGEYPGSGPDWDQRYTISCDMKNNETGATSAYFGHGDLDYALGGSLFVYLNDAVENWYSDLRELAEQSGQVDMKLIPSLDAPLNQIIDIEKLLSE